MHPVPTVLGFTALAFCFALFVYLTNNQNRAKGFKRDHPIFCLAAVLGTGYFVVYMFGAVLVFMFGIAFPLLCKYSFEAFPSHLGSM